MNNGNLTANYTKVRPSSKTQILIMLYDGTIKFLYSAVKKIEENNMEEKRTYIAKGVAIISELSAALDLEVGGSVAKDLESLYAYMNLTLTKANLHNDTAAINSVIVLLQDMKDTWQQAIKIAAEEAGQQNPTVAPVPTVPVGVSAQPTMALNLSA